MEILLFSKEDIEAAVETIVNHYYDIGQPFFKRFSTLEDIDEIFNNPPFESTPAFIGGMFDQRCMRGLIINRLLKKDNFLELAKIYDEQIIQTMNEKSIDDYNKIKEYLMYNKL